MSDDVSHFKDIYFSAMDANHLQPLHQILRAIDSHEVKHKIILLSKHWKKEYDEAYNSKNQSDLDKSNRMLHLNAHLNAHKSNKIITKSLDRLLELSDSKYLTISELSLLIKTANESLKLLKTTEVVITGLDKVLGGELTDDENAVVAEIENLLN